MNNLKRILSLALASVMVMGMMVVGASAAEFSDAEDIENKAAVDTMVALGIIGGYDDGTFKPEGDVTRAQMAKMIAVALNGGKDPKVGMPTTPTFTDTATHWAAEYIEYCANLGIIGGYGDGTFKPEGKVTGQEAAKMMLVAIGYDADIFGFTGSKWAVNVDYYASNLTTGEAEDDKGTGTDSLSLYDGVSSMSNATLTRDNAAQLICNGLNANTVAVKLAGVTNGAPTYSYNLYGDSLLVSAFKADVTTGIMTGVSESNGVYSYTIDKGGDEADATFDTETDMSDLFMQKVRVVSKTTTRDGTIVLAMTGAANDIVATGAVRDLKWNSTTKKLNGYTVNVDGTKANAGKIDEIPVFVRFNGEAVEDKDPSNYATNEMKAAEAGLYTYQLIDNDGDGAINCVVIVPFELIGTVANASAAAVTINGTAYRYEDEHEIYDDPTEGDVVMITAKVDGTKKLEKVELVNGTVGATRNTTTNPNQIRVDGTWYTVPVTTAYSEVNAPSNTQYNFVLVNGYVHSAIAVSTGSTATNIANLAMVLAADTGLKGGSVFDSSATKYQQIQVLLTDGTKTIINVNKINGATFTQSSNPATALTTATNAGDIYALSVENDYYQLKTPDLSNLTDHTASNTVTEISGGVAKVNGVKVRINADAVLFVKAEDGYTVVTGADVATWEDIESSDLTTNGDTKLYGTTVSGFKYASYGVLDLGIDLPGAAGDLGFGWIVEDAYTTIEGSKTYINVKLWDGAKDIDVKQEKGESDNVSALTAGKPVSFEDLGSGMVKGLTPLTNTGRITAFNGTIIVFDAGEKKLSDFVVIYVDTKTNKGYTTGSIKLGTNVDNVYTDGASYMFVDVNNAVYGAPEDPTCDHEALVEGTTGKTAAVAANCVEKGNPNYWQCPVCNKYFTAETASGDGAATAPENAAVDATNHKALAWTVIDNDMATATPSVGTEDAHIQYCSACHTAEGSEHAADAAATDSDGCTLGGHS